MQKFTCKKTSGYLKDSTIKPLIVESLKNRESDLKGLGYNPPKLMVFPLADTVLGGGPNILESEVGGGLMS